MLFKANKLKEDDVIKYFNSLKIKKNEILLEDSSKTGLEGSIYYILEELCNNKQYKHIKKYIVLKKNKINTFQKILKSKSIRNVKLLEYCSKEYSKKICESKYLINNNVFPNNFIKRKGQIYINIVDEIPLTTIGRSNKNTSYAIGNKQRNFLMADYIICPNNDTLTCIRKEYMLDNLYHGKYIISGLPKNDIFFNINKENELKHKINPQNKKIIVYAPTHRKKIHLEEQEYEIKELLSYLDTQLDDEYLVYLKLTNKTKIKVNFEEYTKIYKFPNGYELNEILSISDIFITDYSSSIFDYSITNNQIISYSYDMI